MVALNKLRAKTTEYNKSVTCRYIIHIIMPSWVLPHIKTVVALGSYYLAFWTRWGLMEDFRIAKSTDFLHEVGNVSLRL